MPHSPLRSRLMPTLMVCFGAFLLLGSARCDRSPQNQAAAAPTSANNATPAPVAQPNGQTKQIRGFSMQLNDPSGTKEYIQAIDDIAAMGCTSINFVIAARMDDAHATAVRMKWQNLPNGRDLERILKHAKQKGMYTILMPIVLLDKAGAKEWRGIISPGGGSPDDWNAWFDTYIIYMTMAADLARKSDVDLFCVGSELLSTESYREQWLRTIKTIREHFHGKLTYSANWDHYDREHQIGGPTFWDQLDYIGMNNYNELAKEHGAPMATLMKRWAEIRQSTLAFVAKEKKPFFFTEVGWHNLDNTISEPWNYVAEGKIDLEEQKRAYQSFVDAWKDVGSDQFMGALVWEWRPGANGRDDHGAYSLQNTPALEVVKKWMQGK